ncbi:MAG: hypothetical protein HRT58_12230 [Crocinitomicaceae bacterium]|nr:hypothetical protein [Flavobacteriales bacterium]NQZ36429.1 hypothetical protein [Crocinitomicaceae bacterium]
MENRLLKEEEISIDIICQVITDSKSLDTIYSVLDEFIPGYVRLNLDYTGKPNDDEYEFESEEEMLSSYMDTPNVEQSFYWNKYSKSENPDNIMVGANITTDNHIVFSLTFNGTQRKEKEYYLRLKEYLYSDVGVISYVNPAEYNNGIDFKTRYGDKKYSFES